MTTSYSDHHQYPPPVARLRRAVSAASSLPPLSGLLPPTGSAFRVQPRPGHSTIWPSAGHANRGVREYDLRMRYRARAPPPDCGPVRYGRRWGEDERGDEEPMTRMELATRDALTVFAIDTTDPSRSPVAGRKFLDHVDHYFETERKSPWLKPRRVWLPLRWVPAKRRVRRRWLAKPNLDLAAEDVRRARYHPA